MKPHVDFFIPSYENEEEGMVMHFTSVEEIDSVIESLNEARAELEHLIEMKRIRNHNKRVRRNLRKKFCSAFELDKLSVRDKTQIEEMDFSNKKPIPSYEDLLKKFESKDDFVGDILREIDEFNKLSEKEKIEKIFKDYEKLDKASKEFLRPIINALKFLRKDIDE